MAMNAIKKGYLKSKGWLEVIDNDTWSIYGNVKKILWPEIFEKTTVWGQYYWDPEDAYQLQLLIDDNTAHPDRYFFFDDFKADPKLAVEFAEKHGLAIIIDNQARIRVRISIPTENLPMLDPEI